MIGLKHRLLNYKAKLCTVNGKTDSFDLNLVDYQNTDEENQDVYFSGISISAVEKIENINFDRALLFKMKKALKRFQRCLKKNSQDCELQGLLNMAYSEKVINVELEQLLSGSLKISKMIVEPLFSASKRRRRDIAARPTIFVPKACRDPKRLKCHGGVRITAKPHLAAAIASSIQKNTFVKFTVRKRFNNFVVSSNGPKRRMRKAIVVHYNNNVSKSKMTIKRSHQNENVLDVMYKSLKALSHF